jgi:tetratricopeptide (TPR) repeat protein
VSEHKREQLAQISALWNQRNTAAAKHEIAAYWEEHGHSLDEYGVMVREIELTIHSYEGNSQDYELLVQELTDYFREKNDDYNLTRLRLSACNHEYRRQQLQRIHDLAMECLTKAREHEWLDIESHAHFYLGMHAVITNRWADAREHLERARELANRLKLHDHSYYQGCVYLGWAYASQEWYNMALRLADEASDYFFDVGNKKALLEVMALKSFISWCEDDLPESRRHLQNQVEMASELNIQDIESGARVNLGLVLLYLGGYIEAHREFLRAWQLSEQINRPMIGRIALTGLCAHGLLTNESHNAFNYANLAVNKLPGQLHEIKDDLVYYYPLAWLGGGQVSMAQRYWPDKLVLESRRDNLIRLHGLKRVMEHMLSPEFYESNTYFSVECAAQLRRWLSQVKEWTMAVRSDLGRSRRSA